MKLLVISYKVGWRAEAGYVTYAGFPYQIEALSALFDETTVTLLIRNTPAIAGSVRIQGHEVNIFPLPEPSSSNLRRKLTLLVWLPRHLLRIWHAIQQADAVHALVPGDIGSIGMLVALLQRKLLFVRHCGTWGEPVTLSDRILLWLLERIAGGKNVVLATGGSDQPPSQRNRHIHWIFSTTLSQREVEEMPPIKPWKVDQPLRLVTVGRLTPQKNILAIIEALPQIRSTHPKCHLDLVGDGEFRSILESRVFALGLEQAVTFHGNVSHEKVLQILSGTHLFVFPTRVKEGFPKALLEAMACGLPVIATRVSVVPQLLQNSCGLLLDDTSSPAVAQAVLQVTSNPQKMAEMGFLARQAARGYTLEAWAQRIGMYLRPAWGPLKQGEV